MMENQRAKSMKHDMATGFGGKLKTGLARFPSIKHLESVAHRSPKPRCQMLWPLLIAGTGSKDVWVPIAGLFD